MANAIKKNSTSKATNQIGDENFNLILNAKHASVFNFPLLSQVFDLLQRNFSKDLKDFLNCDTSVDISENKNVQFWSLYPLRLNYLTLFWQKKN